MYVGNFWARTSLNVPVNVTLKANKVQAKEIKRLLIQKKIEIVLTSMDDNNAGK